MSSIAIFAIYAQKSLIEVNEKPDKTVRNVFFLVESSQT